MSVHCGCFSQKMYNNGKGTFITEKPKEWLSKILWCLREEEGDDMECMLKRADWKH